jgi:hypothetical protein
MKKTAFKLASISLLIVLVMGCSKSDPGVSSTVLKDAISSSAQNLNNAVTEITTNQAFQLLSISSSGMTYKSGTVYTTNIPLSLIKGVYDYKALKTTSSQNDPLIRFFTQSADPSKMVINMPLAKLKDPRNLRVYLKADSALTNNFSMTVSNYYNNYNNYSDYDYVNVADISIDKVKAGSLNIKSLVSPTTGTQYASSFAFSNGYTAKYAYASGDTTVSSFAIVKANATLYEEKLLTVKAVKTDNEKFGREHTYILTIGDVKLVRNSDHTSQVYLKNVLQPKAIVAMVDVVPTTEPSICHKREIQITFEDGTVATISSLISKSITDITTLFTSLHDVYFAAYVADWIGYDIYYKR